VWWWIATPLVITLPIVVWFALDDLTDGELYGDGSLESTTFWVVGAVASAVAGLAGVGLHQAALRLSLARRPK
jgi:hypothetical protein